MKAHYLLLGLLSFIISAVSSHAQVVNQIYDHDTTDLNQLHNMPFDETKLLVVSGFSFSPEGIKFHELDQSTSQLVDLSFNNVDTLFSAPEFKDDKMFFEASISGLGRELVAYDGTSTYFFDFNIGPGSSEPNIVEFEDEIYVIASDGSDRQLYKYTGGTSFFQITEEVGNDVVQFIANRGDEYYYTTYNPTNGKSIKTTEDNNGILTHSIIAPTSFQESIGDVVILNGNIFLLSYLYTFNDASYRVDKIDASNTITTHHYEMGGQFSGGHLFAYNNDLLFYRDEPNHAEILNVSVPQQPVIQVSIDPTQYQIISGHVVQNGKLFIYGFSYIMDVSNSTPIPLIEDALSINVSQAFERDSSFYLYEIAPFASGEPSGIIEVSSITNQTVRYTVSNDGGSFFQTHPMVENNGELKFIFREEGTIPSTDIYSFSSVLSLNEQYIGASKPYPNPVVNGHFSLELQNNETVNLMTIEGQLIESFELNSGMNEISVEGLSTGIYLVQRANSVERLFVK